ncbi:MAG: hypothetical protein V7746_19255 [Halioglobus sp.]
MNDRSWQHLFLGSTLTLLALLLWHHWQIITSAVPLDLYEGTMVLITGIIAEGGNPYTREFQPQAADVYPPLYNMLAALLSPLFGNHFQLHRALSGFFIVLACATCGFATWRQSGVWRYALAAGVLWYAALLFYATPISSTNAPGVALFLACLVIPWCYRFNTPSLMVALVCGLLSFYTKQYFILCMAILCLYLFLYVSMTRALVLGISFACALLASLMLVHSSSPYFLDNTLFAPTAAIDVLQDSNILFLQLKLFVRTYLGLLLILLFIAIAALRQRGFGLLPKSLIPAGNGWSGPLLSMRADLFWFSLFWATMAIMAWLGRNPGNYMSYLFQLMSPFLLIAGLSAIARANLRHWIIIPLLLLTYYQSWAILHKDFSVDMGNWRRVEALIDDSDEVLATQMLVVAQLERGKPVFQDGHTSYFPQAFNKPDWMRKNDPEARVEAVWNDYLTLMYQKIQRAEFDYILVSPWEMRGIFVRNPPPFEDIGGKEFLSRHYCKIETFPLSMTHRHGAGTWNIQVWQPRPCR